MKNTKIKSICYKETEIYDIIDFYKNMETQED